MSDNLEKLAAASDKAERITDYWGTKLLDFPYSWIPVAITLALAVYGAFQLVL